MSVLSALPPAHLAYLCATHSLRRSSNLRALPFSRANVIVMFDPRVGTYSSLPQLRQDYCSFTFRLAAAGRLTIRTVAVGVTGSPRVIRQPANENALDRAYILHLPAGCGWLFTIAGPPPVTTTGPCVDIIVAEGFRPA